MIKACVFDLEGPIIDVEDKHFEAMRSAAEEVGVIFDPDNLVADIASKIPNAIGGGDAVNSRGIWDLSDKRASIEEISSRKFYFYDKLIEELTAIEPRSGFLEVFEQIRSLGIPVAIASLTPRHQAEILLERSGVGKLFPQHLILLRDSVEKAKPAPDVYLKAARLLDVWQEEQLVFEDSATGLMAARTAGSPAVAMPIYTFPENIQKLQDAGAREIFYSWEDVDIEKLLNKF